MTEYEFIKLVNEIDLHLEGDVWVDPWDDSPTWFYLMWCDIDKVLDPVWTTECGIDVSFDRINTKRIDLMVQHPDRYYKIFQANVPEGCTIPYKIPTINVLDIKVQTMADGPGLRNALYVAGCEHKCPGCHNPQSWDFNGGNPMNINDIAKKLLEQDGHITISGGDPMAVPNRHNILLLLEVLRTSNPYKNIWLYTGYKYEQLITDPIATKILSFIDVLVDGPYINELRNTEQYCGSTNQRFLYLKDGKPISQIIYENNSWNQLPIM